MQDAAKAADSYGFVSNLPEQWEAPVARRLGIRVAIVGETWWAVNAARDTLKVDWATVQSDSSEGYAREAERLAVAGGDEEGARNAVVDIIDGQIDFTRQALDL